MRGCRAASCALTPEPNPHLLVRHRAERHLLTLTLALPLPLTPCAYTLACLSEMEPRGISYALTLPLTPYAQACTCLSEMEPRGILSRSMLASRSCSCIIFSL